MWVRRRRRKLAGALSAPASQIKIVNGARPAENQDAMSSPGNKCMHVLKRQSIGKTGRVAWGLAFDK